MHLPLILADLPRGLKWGLLAVAGLLLLLTALNQPLQTGSAPQGIVSFEMAATAEQSLAILRSWRGAAIDWARISLWLDFLFVAAYLQTLWLLTSYLSRDRPGIRERATARWLKVLFAIAATADVAENILLLNNLSTPTDTVSLAATLCALVKFTGLIIGCAGLVIIRAARRHPLTQHRQHG